MNSEIIDTGIAEILRNNRKPSAIILHPETYKQFVTSLSNEFVGVDFTSIKDPKYRGIKIYRTEDIDENKVEVY